MADIQIIKFVSPDGGNTWIDANTPPGPIIPQGINPKFKYVVTNLSMLHLTGVSISDSVLGLISVGGILAPGASATFYATGKWAPGQYSNVAKAIGTVGQHNVSDTDTANYFGSSVPVFPPLPPPIPQSQIIDYLLETIAFEELALAALVNAEAEKIQAVAAAGVLGPVEPDALTAINNSVNEVVNQAIHKEQLLSLKLARILAHKQVS
jgi:hypothetical protein